MRGISNTFMSLRNEFARSQLQRRLTFSLSPQLSSYLVSM